MRFRERLVDCLLHLYPAEWRREYGPEFADLLNARPIDVRVLTDVVCHGVLQRARAAEASEIMGLVAMLFTAVGLTANVVDLPRVAQPFVTVLRETHKTWPTVAMTPFGSDNLFALFLVGCGCWTSLRNGRSSKRCGIAAMKVTFIAGLPVMVAGVLMLVGVMHETIGAGQAHLSVPVSYAVLSAPLFQLPQSWIWGMTGGWIGRRFQRSRDLNAEHAGHAKDAQSL